MSMRPPVGYYILPLFPPPKDYRKEYALFGTKAILSDVSLPFMTAEGEAYYFFVLRGDRSAEIVYGGKASGNIIGSVLIVRSVTEKQIADICHQVEETANN